MFTMKTADSVKENQKIRNLGPPINYLCLFLQDTGTQFPTCLPSGNRNRHIESLNLNQQIYPSVSKESFLAVDSHQGISRRLIINTAPLSPNHYGSVLAQASLPFPVNRRSLLPGSRKTLLLTNASEIFLPEQGTSTDDMDLQQTKQNVQVCDEKSLINVKKVTEVQTTKSFILDGL